MLRQGQRGAVDAQRRSPYLGLAELPRLCPQRRERFGCDRQRGPFQVLRPAKHLSVEAGHLHEGVRGCEGVRHFNLQRPTGSESRLAPDSLLDLLRPRDKRSVDLPGQGAGEQRVHGEREEHQHQPEGEAEPNRQLPAQRIRRPERGFTPAAPSARSPPRAGPWMSLDSPPTSSLSRR